MKLRNRSKTIPKTPPYGRPADADILPFRRRTAILRRPAGRDPRKNMTNTTKITNTIKIMDSPVIGVFATCTEDVCLVPKGIREDAADILEKRLNVPVRTGLIRDSILIGSLSRGNSNGFLISGRSGASDLEALLGVPVGYLPGKINAVGNILLANDTAGLVSPEVSDKAIEAIRNVLKIDVRRGTIAGIKTVGMAGCVTNKGLLTSPGLSHDEAALIEDLFGFAPMTGSVNFGSRMTGSGVLANSKGYVTGDDTSGFEMGRVAEALGFVGNDA